jgi:hypothetical protein
MKLSAGYTEAIGTDLGIVGSAATEKALPKFSAELIQGGGCQCVKLTFYKYNHMGVYIEGRRGTGRVGVPRHRHRKPLHRRTPAARRRHPRSARIPHALLGQRHPERRLDRCGEGHGPGNPGDPGPPGEVSSMQLNDAIQTTSANSNSVAELAGAISDPPQQMEVQAIADKIDELILALRRT